MKPIKKIGIVEKILNNFGYYRPVERKTRKPRTKKAIKPDTRPYDAVSLGLDQGPLT